MSRKIVDKCGGDLRAVEAVHGRAGEKVPCPYCGKPVMLRHPFNAAATGFYVQIPMHKKLSH